MHHKEIERRLIDAYEKKTGLKGRVRLPDPEHIVISGEDEHPTIYMKAKAVVANMQENCAAFEGWALALLAWLDEVKTVAIDWDTPEEDVSSKDLRHYQRLLYRIARFQELLGPGLVKVYGPNRLDALEIGGRKRMLVNVTKDVRLAVSESEPDYQEIRFERDLELRLTAPGSRARASLMNACRLRHLDRQFLVGVFDSVVAETSRVFPGGKSAIDIIGIGEDRTLWLMELKVRKNVKVGALSELFFYSMIMHDVLRGQMELDKQTGKIMSHVRPDHVRECKRIKACLLDPPIHPLFKPERVGEEPRAFEILNKSAGRQGWPVHFGTLDISGHLTLGC